MQFVLSTKESLKHVGRCCSKVKLLCFFFLLLLKHCLATCLAARREWIKCKCSDEDQ